GGRPLDRRDGRDSRPAGGDRRAAQGGARARAAGRLAGEEPRDVGGRAGGEAEREGLDHLAIMPELVLPGLVLQAFGLAFLCWGMAVLRPWKARDPRSWRFVGIGAFNLV